MWKLRLYANKVYCHIILSTLFDALFDVYKEVKSIWEFMIIKYIVEDVKKQKFIIENYYCWKMNGENGD